MRLDGALLDDELRRDLRIGEPSGDERSTSSSRAVSSLSCAGSSEAGRAARANRRIRRHVTDGSIRASPAAMQRTAPTSCSGGASFSRNPLALILSVS